MGNLDVKGLHGWKREGRLVLGLGGGRSGMFRGALGGGRGLVLGGVCFFVFSSWTCCVRYG